MDVSEASALLDGRLAEACAEHDVPVASYGLVLAGELVHVGSVGDLPVDRAATTPFRIASMTKSFTAATILRLRDDGLLSLETPLADILPWASTVGLPASSPALRIGHLLTMTGGFPTDDPWGDRHESSSLDAFDALVAGGLTFCRPPGIDFEYANIGYALLGRVIAAVTGLTYTEAVRSAMLEPLGLTATTFDVVEASGRIMGRHPTARGLIDQVEGSPGAFSPMGGLWSTVTDLARWVGFMEAAWSDDPHDGPLGRWTRREMQRPHAVVGFEADGSIDSYGMGLRIADHRELGRFVHHSGGYPGFGSHMRWHPDTRWGVVALANRTYAPMRAVCASALMEIVADDAATAARERAVARLWPQTKDAMALVERLLIEWSDVDLDGAAAFNLDLDQSRRERRDAWAALGVRSVERESGSIWSRSPAHAHWRVATDVGAIELDVLMTGEQEPKIQAMSAVRGNDNG